MILDTTYVFFILNNTVYSRIYETGNKGTVSACKYLRYESNLSKQNNETLKLLQDFVAAGENSAEEFD
ncbi:MAG: hypothetical protein KAI79_08570 [Bacteroidales bacterium]|nr:hypothetical protein [Bacteroidales bacterium]